MARAQSPGRPAPRTPERQVRTGGTPLLPRQTGRDPAVKEPAFSRVPVALRSGSALWKTRCGHPV